MDSCDSHALCTNCGRCEVLNGFGNKTPMEERRRQFDAMDINHSGAIDFEEFIAVKDWYL